MTTVISHIVTSPSPHPGSTVTVRATVRDSAGDLVAAAAITMVWKNGPYGTETTETPSNVSTGLYEASFVPEAGGNHYVRWDTTTTEGTNDVSDEQIIPVRASAFDDYR